MENEAKETTPQTVRDDGESVVDSVLDKAYGGEATAEDTSTSKSTDEQATDETEETGADQTKPEDSEDEDADVRKKGFHNDPAWQRIMKQRDEARQKEKELGDKFANFESKMAEWEKVTNSPTFIRTKMEAEGYKPEVIDAQLAKLGHEVSPRATDDVDLVLSKLGIQKDTLTQEQKDYINVYVSDAAKVADIIFNDRINKVLPKMIDPLQKSVSEMTQKTTANQLVNEMKTVITSEGVLDFDKDISPGLDAFMTKNPNATQEDVFAHFKELNHRISIERLKTGGRKTERDKTKGDLRGNKPGVGTPGGKLPGWNTGNSESANLDALLDAAGYVH